MTIEDVLRQRAGEGLRISLFPASSGYQASLSSDDGKSWRVELAASAEIALMKVLGMVPGASGGLWLQPATTSAGAFD